MSEVKEHTHAHNSSSQPFNTLLTGVILGATLTYLFTTESGKKIREELLKEGSKLLENMGNEIDLANKKAEESKEKLVEEVGQKKKEIEEEIHEVAAEVKKDIKTIRNDISDIPEEIPHQVEEIQKKGRRFFFSKKSSTHES